MTGEYQICSQCVMDRSDSAIHFDENGVCDYCQNYRRRIEPHWQSLQMEDEALARIAREIKQAGKGKEFDCIIGFSGGMDSSYLCYVAKELMGLRPLLYSVDTGWNTREAQENQRKIAEALELELYTEVVDWQEMSDLQLAFLKSGVAYQDSPQDSVIFAGLYNFSVKRGIRYVLSGANTATEGIRPPVEWVYANDLRMQRDIHRRFGKRELKTLPQCGMFKYRVYYPYVKGMKRVAPLEYVSYNKEEARHFLERRFGWEAYANKHYENIFTRWYEGYYLPTKFAYDKRRCYFSNLILTGEMGRAEALAELERPAYAPEQMETDTAYIAERLGIGKDELLSYVHGANKSFRDYKNSYRLMMLAIRAAQLLGVEKRSFR